MNVLYKGDTPLATTAPKDASELPYSNGVSVKDKIDGILIRSIPANSYNTYALALADLETYFNALSFEEKARTAIIRGDRLIYRISYIEGKSFYYSNLDNASANTQSFNLYTHKYYVSTLTTNAFAISDSSNNAQDQSLKLYVF